MGATGTKRLEDLKYVWLRDAEVIRDANIPEYPDVKLLVWGTMVYDIVGGKFIYSRFRVGYNSYLGIPNPKESDIKSFLGACRNTPDRLTNKLIRYIL